MANNVQAKHSGSIGKEQEFQKKGNLFQALLHLPPRTWSLLEIIVLRLLSRATSPSLLTTPESKKR